MSGTLLNPVETVRKLQEDFDRGYQDGLLLLHLGVLDIPESDLNNDWYMNGYWAARNEWEEVQ